MTRLFIALKILSLWCLTASANAAPTRIISLTPAISESLVSMGLSDQIVGRDQATDHPDLIDLPVVADYQQVYLEPLLKLMPTTWLAGRTHCHRI